MSMSTPTVVRDEVNLAAYGLQRCEICARILVETRLAPDTDGSWYCRDRDYCDRVASARSVPHEAGDETDEDIRERVALVVPITAALVAEPYLNAAGSCCGSCWQHFPEEQLIVVHEELGLAYRCHGCLRTPRTLLLNGSLPDMGDAISVILQR